MSLASFESNARRKQTSFESKPSPVQKVEDSPKITRAVIDQMVKRLSTGSAGDDDDTPKVTVLKDLMKYYSDRDLTEATLPAPQKTFATNLPWKDIGMYTGQVNKNFEPHGEGTLHLHNGATLQGQWANGRPVSNDDTNRDDTRHEEKKPSAKAASSNSGSKDKGKKATQQEEKEYEIGDEGRRRDMIKDSDKDVALMRIASLQPDDAAFIRRTNGTWTFSRVKKVTQDSIYFIVNPSGSTKSYKAKYWHSHVRTCKTEAKKSTPKESPARRRSSDGLTQSDSELSSSAPILQHSQLQIQESPKKSPPPKTFEIKQIREYEPSKNRFSVKDLRPPVADNSEESSRETQRSGSGGTGVLRRGRFSFHGDGKYISRKRNVSISLERNQTRSYKSGAEPDDESAIETEDEDDAFDVNGGISSRGGYSLRGIEP